VVGYDRSLAGETLISDRVTSPVINAGVVWQLITDKNFQPPQMFYQGFAVSNINRPKGFLMEENQLSTILYKFHGGYLKTFRNGLEISPNYLVQHQKVTQVNVGAYAAYTVSELVSKPLLPVKVSIGFWYRMQDSFILTTGLSTPQYNFGFSYDANATSMQRSFDGANAMEFSFAYKINIMKEYKRFSSPLL
jgi:hypothetical protein